MDEVLERLGDVGIVPVLKIENASHAVPVGKALLAGDLPVAEVTFRTAAAEDAMRAMTRELPDLLVGAGTVLTVAQVDGAIAAGAKFIVAPGFDPRVVDYCISKGVPIVPGISTASEISMGVERSLPVLKVFPVGVLGGVDFIKSICGPFSGVLFMPTGGVDPSNLRDYLSYNRVHCVGGTWIAKEAVIASGKFDEITRLAREAMMTSLGFELAHLGLNEGTPDKAMAGAHTMARLFSFAVKDGNSSTFAGASFEFMKKPYLGAHGHIGIATTSIARATAWLRRKGVGVKPETAKEKDGKLTAIYLDAEVGGFAVHLLQR